MFGKNIKTSGIAQVNYNLSTKQKEYFLSHSYIIVETFWNNLNFRKQKFNKYCLIAKGIQYKAQIYLKLLV